MPRITSLNMLLESEGKDYLAELYGKVIENVQKALVSSGMKNTDLSGDPVSGSVEAKRFANATSKDYGTARAAGKGDAVKASPVTIVIDQDKEIVEELEEKDIKLSAEDYDAAFEAASTFIDCGREWKDSPRKSPRVMDWEQDGSLLFPAISKVAGREVRTVDYMHWWTFMGCYMEISDGVFSTILSLRQKRAKGKKLEKWEREFWEANKDICVLKKKISREEQEERDRLKALLG